MNDEIYPKNLGHLILHFSISIDKWIHKMRSLELQNRRNCPIPKPGPILIIGEIIKQGNYKIKLRKIKMIMIVALIITIVAFVLLLIYHFWKKHQDKTTTNIKINNLEDRITNL